MHVFLSARFDDAVLSCGAYIRSLTMKGMNVTIMTVMNRFEAVIHPQKPSPVRSKLGAIACYESQISTFWDNLNDMKDAVQTHVSIPMPKGRGF